MRKSLDILRVHGSVRMRLHVVKLLLDKGASLPRLSDHIDCLFILLAFDYRPREKFASGFSRFSKLYDHYYREFYFLHSVEEIEGFFDRFYMFLDKCFPLAIKSDDYLETA